MKNIIMLLPLAAAAVGFVSTEASAMSYASESFTAVLKRTSAVVELRITDRQFTYQEDLGPGTVYTADVAFVYAGTSPSDKQLQLRFAGGPTPDGRYMEIAGAPEFAIGHTYVLFLPNETEPWSGMPIAACWSYFELLPTADGVAPWSPSEYGWLTGTDQAGHPVFTHTGEKPTEHIPLMSLPSSSEVFGNILQNSQAKDSVAATGNFINTPAHSPFRGSTAKAEVSK